MADLRVAVVSGGLGGLCLAQGLLARGVDVTVFERDPAPTAGGKGTGCTWTHGAGWRSESACPANFSRW